MQVHVIRSEGFAQEQCDLVLQELESVSGLVSFKRQVNAVTTTTQQALAAMVTEEATIADDADLARTAAIQQAQSWDYFFNQCDTYRLVYEIPDNDMVVLLTPEWNSLFHFAAFADKQANIFIHTADWDTYLFCSPVYPIAYLVMSQVLQKIGYQNMKVKSSFAHKNDETVGCMNDYCEEKAKITLKMRTGDICQSCMKFFLEAGVKEEYMVQALALFEKLRQEMLFKQRHQFNLAPRNIHIRRGQGRKSGLFVSFPSLVKEVYLNPKQSVLYLFYLNHPEGVPFYRLWQPKHRDKLAVIYRNISNRKSLTLEQDVADAVKKWAEDGKHREADISNMRKAFRKELGEKLAEEYIISDLKSGDKDNKGIRLDRSLVTYDADIINYVLCE